MRNIF